VSQQAIEVTEGDAVTYTITVKRAGTAVNLSGYTVTFYAHADGAAFGTNQINGGACSIVGDGSAGQVTYPITAANTALGTTNTQFKGTWSLKLVSGAIVEWTKRQPIFIYENPFILVSS
jgi:hypothetical protein